MDADAAEESQAIVDAEGEGEEDFNENGSVEDDGYGDEAGGDEFGEAELDEGDQRGCMDVFRGQVDASWPDDFK